MASCLFCSIAAGDVAAYTVEEDARAIVFLDHRPLFPGHCLVVPKTHYETLSDLPEGEVGSYFQLVQRVARAVEKGLAADGTFVAVNNRVSQSVAHLHVHVVPRRRKDGLRGFFWPRQKYDDEAGALAARNAIRGALH
jgi:histidine triad (HIT) family protein